MNEILRLIEINDQIVKLCAERYDLMNRGDSAMNTLLKLYDKDVINHKKGTSSLVYEGWETNLLDNLKKTLDNMHIKYDVESGGYTENWHKITIYWS